MVRERASQDRARRPRNRDAWATRFPDSPERIDPGRPSARIMERPRDDSAKRKAGTWSDRPAAPHTARPFVRLEGRSFRRSPRDTDRSGTPDTKCTPWRTLRTRRRISRERDHAERRRPQDGPTPPGRLGEVTPDTARRVGRGPLPEVTLAYASGRPPREAYPPRSTDPEPNGASRTDQETDAAMVMGRNGNGRKAQAAVTRHGCRRGAFFEGYGPHHGEEHDRHREVSDSAPETW